MKIIPAKPEDLARIEAAAAGDGHIAIAPTHFLQDGTGAVRGAYSAGGASLLMFWSHTVNDKMNSIRFAKQAIADSRFKGLPVLALCTSTSPFAPLMPGLGFEDLGNANLFRLK